MGLLREGAWVDIFVIISCNFSYEMCCITYQNIVAIEQSQGHNSTINKRII